MKKTRSRKSRDTVPLSALIQICTEVFFIVKKTTFEIVLKQSFHVIVLRQSLYTVCFGFPFLCSVAKWYHKHLRICTAKTKCRKFETNIPRKGISGPQSQFPHSCVCERIIYSHDGSDFSVRGNMWPDPWNI
jgi:hypothetical protein